MSSDPAVGRPLTSSHGPNHGPVIGIVGAGAAGTLVAIHLLRELRASGTAADIVLIDPAESGCGVAYATPDVRHLLNVAGGADERAARRSRAPPRAGLDVRPDATLRDAALDDFLPRRAYGAYLRDTLDHEIARSGQPACCAAGSARWRSTPGAPRTRTRTTASRWPTAPRSSSTTSSSHRHLRPRHRLGAAGAARLRPVRRRPLGPGALAAIDDDGDVLLVGTGLTMVDVATSTSASDGRVLHAVSRRGRLPKAHGPRRLAAVEPTDLPVDLDIDDVAPRRTRPRAHHRAYAW